MWKRLKLVTKLESDLRETLDWGRKWVVDFKAGKTQLVSFERSYNSSAIDVKMDGSVLEKVSSLRCYDCLSPLNWTGALILFLVL